MLGGMRRSREEWAALVAEFRSSGARADDFARRRGLKVATLQWWCSELRRAAARSSLLPVRFVPLRPAASVEARCKPVEARVGSVILRFETGTDVEYVAALLGRLGKAC
jgi:hypothetical protein